MVELTNSRCWRWGGEIGESVEVINSTTSYTMDSYSICLALTEQEIKAKCII